VEDIIVYILDISNKQS